MDPETRYTRAGDIHIAYQVIGDGPFDLLIVPGGFGHLDLHWADRRWRGFLLRLAEFSRLIVFDKRGTGLSDPTPDVATLEDLVEDVLAVLDATGSQRPALLGISEGGPCAALFAATHPERTRALVMYGTFACGDLVEDPGGGGYPEAANARWWSRAMEVFEGEEFGTGASLQLFAPSLDIGPEARRRWGMLERASTSPGRFKKQLQTNREIDVRSVLGVISTPTLVVHRAEDPLPVEGARYIAERIPDARLVILPGDDHIPSLGDAETLVSEIEEFLTGTRHASHLDRALVTILFTDVAASTERAAALGDRAWRELLERHDELVRERLERHSGREVKTLGDGFLAVFPGPAAAIRCAREIVDDAAAALGLGVRAAVHTGECEVRGSDVGGLAVHIGARIGALSRAGEVLVSGTVRDLVVGSGIAFEDRGTHELRGVPGEWRLLAVAS